MSVFHRLNRVLMFLVMLLYVPLTLGRAAVLSWGACRLTVEAVHWISHARLSPRGPGLVRTWHGC